MTARARTRLTEEDRRRELLAATVELMAEQGWRAIRVADIAGRCGVSPGLVLYHFGGKDALLDEAFRFAFQAAGERHARELAGIADTRERLARLVELQLPDGEVRAEWLVWLQFWTEAALAPRHRELHAELYRRWWEAIRDVVRRGQREGTFRADLEEDRIAEFTALFDGLAIQVLTRAYVDVAAMRRILLAFARRELFA